MAPNLAINTDTKQATLNFVQDHIKILREYVRPNINQVFI